MPLAAGYVVSCINSDERLHGKCSAKVKNFQGKLSPLEMALDIISKGVPDVVGFSVLGWNYKQFINVARTLKQYNDRCLIVFGGNHVSNQAAKVFTETHDVDIIVNGEGEFTIADILHAHVNSLPLNGVDGISFVGTDGEVETTAPRARIVDLDTIPSPILNGTIPLTDHRGAFRYDVALIETNRGCPYQCSFCYWGGATGQKIRAFSMDRLRAETTELVRAGAETLVLCDANFGMLRQDLEFVELLIELKERYGRPHALETSWAKNKNAMFYEIVQRMNKAGLQSSFTIALQTLNENALDQMNRKNMKINDWKELALWLQEQNLDVYAELIWGAPGETLESFLNGYDELSEYVSRIATYPMLLLPNTDYGDNPEKYGFKTIKGVNDDFDYVLSNDSADLTEHSEAWRFIFWARLLAENLVFRNLYPVARALLNFKQSEIILSFAGYVETSDLEVAARMKNAAEKSIADPDSLAPILEVCFTDPQFDILAHEWLRSLGPSRIGFELLDVFSALLAFDLDTRPVVDPHTREYKSVQERVDVRGRHWLLETQYDFDIPTLLGAVSKQISIPIDEVLQPKKTVVALRFKQGFETFVRSTNHEETVHFVAEVVEFDQVTEATQIA
ncbi:radical SAM domain protein [Rhodobacteraceae bacterium KLH11]|nr:radical SAM domain protein [Rhodobacteraceae bacterium KLH11]